MTPLNRWCVRRRGAILVSLVFAAAIVRIVYFVELNHGPLVWQHRWAQTDMNTFDRWAKAIASGDVLSRNVDPPLHHWHVELAKEYYARHPDLAPLPVAAENEAQTDVRRARLLWKEWIGPGRYYQEPLYPYLLAATYALSGSDVRFVFAWQLALGIVLIVVLHAVTRRAFGDFTALIAGVVALLYAPLLMYEMVLLRDSLVALTGLALTLLMQHSLRRPTARAWLVVGLACGAALLLKSHFILMTLGAGALLAMTRLRRSPKRRADLKCAVGFFCGLALMYGPLVARNLAVGAPALVAAGNAGASVSVSNAEGAGVNGWSFSHFIDIQEQAGGQLLATLSAAIRTHPSLGDYGQLIWQRFLAAWNWYEWPSNECFYYYRLHSTMLRYLPLTFFIVAPLGMAGMLLSLGYLRRCGVLYLPVITNLIVLLLFFVQGRYRLALAAAVIPFAAMVVAQCVGAVRRKHVGDLVMGFVCVGLVLTITSRPLANNAALIRPADFLAPFTYFYGPEIEAAQRRGDRKAASDVLARALAIEPAVVRNYRPGYMARTQDEAALLDTYAQLYVHHARLLHEAGRQYEAASAMARAKALHAGVPSAWPSRLP